MDTVDKKTRSRIMASVGQRDTGAELLLRRALHRQGFRYRLHEKKLPGSPDLVFPKHQAVIFVHGCFWHRHGCKYSTFPSTRKRFWKEKFEANRKRDKKNIDSLIAKGWRALIIWECLIKSKDFHDGKISPSVAKWLFSKNCFKELG